MDSLSNMSISPSADIVMFANDICYSQEVLSLSSQEDCAGVQEDVCDIMDWMMERDLRLNITKTKVMMVSRKRCPPTLVDKVWW